MKRFVAVICVLLFCGCIYANDYVKPLWSVGTAAVIYGNDEVKEFNKTLKHNDFSEIILAVEGGITVKLDEKLQFIAEGLVTFDELYHQSESVLYLDYAFTSGLRVYPGLGGLNVGCEYSTGRRTDFINACGIENEVSSTKWGNGFRFICEYDFSKHVEGLAPVLGIGWRRMPRGNAADNIISFYFRLTK